MPPKKNNDDFASLKKRLDDLEKSLNSKDAEIQELKRQHKLTTEKLNNQDALIAELRSKIEQNPQPIDDDASQPKEEHDLLVIGDSIVRDVSGSVINPGGDTTVKCLPGARPDDVAAEFREMTKTHSFKRIVVHAGTNLIPQYSPHYTADKLVKCMETIRELAPSSKIAFSHVLPKLSDCFLPGINLVNHRVSSSGMIGPSRTRFGCVSHRAYFCNPAGRVNPQLFRKDGIHLSNAGVKQFNESIKLLISKN